MAAKHLTKSEILNSISGTTELSRKQVASVIDALGELAKKNVGDSTKLSRKQVASVFEALSVQIKGNVGKKGPGVFVVPGLMKIMVITKPATKARKGINPFTKQEQMFKAKPARKVIKIRALKALKDAVK